MVSHTVFAGTVPSELPDANPSSESAGLNGLYYTTSDETAPTIKMDSGQSARVGQRAATQILKTHIYSVNNANRDFGARLEVSDYAINTNSGMETPVVLRIGNHGYSWRGGGGSGGHNDVMFFGMSGPDDAKAAAKGLSAECILRSPPGYKFLAQFVPKQLSFHTNEPVLVKFTITNLDDRTMAFQRGGQQRGPRDSQYGFRAMLAGRPVADTGNPMNFGGLFGIAQLEPGKEFVDEIDLKKWFAFDREGTYFIHGFYQLELYQPGKTTDASMPWNVLWSDYASADFVIVVK